jgi:hypothetical protein
MLRDEKAEGELQHAADPGPKKDLPKMASALRIGISQRHLDALLWVRKKLASGELRHYTVDEFYKCRHAFENGIADLEDHNSEGPHAFNMREARDQTDCGTVACIGGWMTIQLNLTGDDKEWFDLWENRVLDDLFRPCCGIDWDDITVEQAIRAIDNFTIHSPGMPRWCDAVGKA